MRRVSFKRFKINLINIHAILNLNVLALFHLIFVDPQKVGKDKILLFYYGMVAVTIDYNESNEKLV